MGHEIIIITTPSIHVHKSKSTNFNVEWGKVYSLSMSAPYGSLRYGLEFTFKFLNKIKKLHNEKSIDLVHGHSGYPVIGLITSIGGKTLGIPSFHTLYCPVEMCSSKNAINRFYLSMINKIISLSNNTKHSLENIGISHTKIEQISPPIDVSVFNPYISKTVMRESHNIKPEDPAMLYIGDLTKTRGLHVLIEALSNIVKVYPDMKLFLAVNMPLEKYIEGNFEIKEKIKSFGLNSNILPLGIIDNMPEIMAGSDIFIAPYLTIESIADYPISLLEAMACSKPVIATKVGGIPEIVKHEVNGLLIEPGNVHELEAAILSILENKDKAKNLGDNAARFVVENFSTNVVAKKYEEVFMYVVAP